MALNSLSELVSLTDSAVKSLNIVNTLKAAGSPFESPRSLQSISDSGVEKTESKSEPSFPRRFESKSKTSKEEKSVKADKPERRNDNSISSRRNNIVTQKKSSSVVVQHHGSNPLDLKKERLNDSKTKVSSSQEENELDSFSSSSHQPRIIDVVSHDVENMRSSASEGNSSLNIIDKVTAANQPECDHYFGQKSFGKTQNSNGQLLKQGDLSKGVLDPTKSKVFDDVYISQFQLTEKQRDLKQALAKRSENNQPKRKQVQPQIIQHKHHGEDGDTEQKNVLPGSKSKNTVSPVSDSAITAAVAASAAVAATQPFLKIQHDLESQIQQLVTQLANLQQTKTSATFDQNLIENGDVKTASHRRILDLERQVTEINERRLEHVESLQQQQFQMQAQLLAMSRSKSPRTEVFPRKHEKSPNRNSYNGSHIPRPVTRDNKAVHLSDYTTSQFRESTHGQNQSSVFHPEALSKHHNYLSEVRELQGSLLDTPAPRRNIPQPTPYTLPEEQHRNLGFLQELLKKNETPDADTTFSVPPGYDLNRNNNSRNRQKSPVDQARRLMSSLTNLEKETAESIWGSRDNSTSKEINPGPAPLDHYLRYPETKGSPYPTLSDIKKEKRHHRPNLDDILEAKKVLRDLETTRETLEKNIEHVVRTSRDMHVFSALLNNVPEGESSDHARIERMVRKKIASLNEDIQGDVLRGLAEEEVNKAAAEAEFARLKAAVKKNPGRFEGTKSRNMKQMTDYSNKLAYKKPGPSIPLTEASSRFNKPSTSKVKQPPKPAAIKDEKTMTRTYGKPEYQRGRTTIRDPYMHFQNAKKGRPAVMNESMVSLDGRSRSPKNQKHQSPVRNGVPRQFFFSPTRGYIPVDVNKTGPIPGKMVEMAIPLGQPRLEPGVRSSAKPVSTTLSNPITSTPVPVTAETKNAAVVSFLMKGQKQGEEREPELSKQVLPPIDIDSISPSSSRITDIQIRSPQQAHPNVTFLQQTHDSDLNKTLTDEDFSVEEQDGEGLEFLGHDPIMPGYSGPDFPPQWSARDRIAGDQPAGKMQLVSDVTAEDLRQKDVLENNAINWLEQELMARVLTEVMPLQVHSNPADVSEAHTDRSEASDKEESLLVADMIGQGGLQLFIDAGQPVDNRLVNILVAEVIQEKINSMLAHKADGPEVNRQSNNLAGGDVGEQDLEDKHRPLSVPRVPTPDPTPKTSPVASPRRAKPQPHIQAPVTPPESPPPAGIIFKPRPTEPQEKPYERDIEEYKPDPVPPTPVVPAAIVHAPSSNVHMQAAVSAPDVEAESDSDITVSIDISEELRRISAQGKSPHQASMPVQVHHDVSTPPISPIPVKEEDEKPLAPFRQTTPPASPPASQPHPSGIVPSSTPSQKREDSRPPIQEEEEKEESEEEEEEIREEPRVILASVAVGDDSPMTTLRETQERRRSPSPKREVRPPHSPTPDSVLLSEESSVSETVNENISEGQWLLSRSEGQIVALPGKVAAQDLRRGYQQMVDLSTASTLHDTEDLDLDVFGTKSEGEVLISGLPAPDQDPMLELLVQMQKNPHLPGHRDIPDSHIAQMIGNTAMRNDMGRSLGEMSMGQVAPSKIIKVQSRQNGHRQHQGRGSPVYSPSGSLDRSGADDFSFEERRTRETSTRHRKQRSPTPPHQEHPRNQRRSQTPDFNTGLRSPDRRSPDLRSPDRRSPDRRSPDRRSPDRRSPDRRSPDRRSPIHRADPRDRSRKQMQYQPVLSEGAPIATRTQRPQSGHRRSGDVHQRSLSAERGIRHSRESAASEAYTSNAYSTDPISRSLDSASFRRSGEGGLTSSLKSRQTGVKKSVEFDLTGTYEGRETTKSSVTASRDSMGSGRLSDHSRSLGINYSHSFDESMDDSELKRIVGGNGSHGGPYRMSVTLPSTYGEDSDISDFNE